MVEAELSAETPRDPLPWYSKPVWIGGTVALILWSCVNWRALGWSALGSFSAALFWFSYGPLPAKRLRQMFMLFVGVGTAFAGILWLAVRLGAEGSLKAGRISAVVAVVVGGLIWWLHSRKRPTDPQTADSESTVGSV